MADLDLTKLGVYDQDSAQDDAFFKGLILGPGKRGKTTAILTSAPDPLVLNCDGIGATLPAARAGGKFKALDVTDCASWKEGCRIAHAAASQGLCKSIVVDTATLLQDFIIEDLKLKFEGRELWNRVLETMMKGIMLLRMAPAHLFVIAHQINGRDTDEGILPLLAGQTAERLPLVLHDVILFVYDEARNHADQGLAERVPHRFFALGAQGPWKYGCRHIKQSCQIPADVGILFEQLGITP